MLYIVGLPRSGTTCLASMLRNSNAVHEFEKLNTFKLIREYKEKRITLLEFFQRWIDRERRKGDVPEANPQFYLILPELIKLYPNIQIIFLLRDSPGLWIESMLTLYYVVKEAHYRELLEDLDYFFLGNRENTDIISTLRRVYLTYYRIVTEIYPQFLLIETSKIIEEKLRIEMYCRISVEDPSERNQLPRIPWLLHTELHDYSGKVFGETRELILDSKYKVLIEPQKLYLENIEEIIKSY